MIRTEVPVQSRCRLEMKSYFGIISFSELSVKSSVRQTKAAPVKNPDVKEEYSDESDADSRKLMENRGKPFKRLAKSMKPYMVKPGFSKVMVG